MRDDQIIAVFRMLAGPPKGQPFSQTAEECRTALLARFPDHATVESIFQTGALSMEYRAEAYAEFGVDP